MKWISLATVLFSLSTFAAPHPATSTSATIGQSAGKYFSQHGFKVSLGRTSWKQVSAPKEYKNIEAVYKGQSESVGVPDPSLTVRRDNLLKKVSLERYVKRWLKDYHRFGFEILTSKKVKVGANVGYMLDLLHPDSAHQLRQVVFVRKKNAVIFTCRDSKKTFMKNLKSCNEIVRTFAWTI